MSSFPLKIFLILLLAVILCLSLWPPGRALLRKLSGSILLGLGALSMVTAIVLLWRGDEGLHGSLVAALLGVFSVYVVSVARGLKRSN